MEVLSSEIAKQKGLFNDLRLNNTDATLLEEAKKKLADLQKEFGILKAADAKNNRKDATEPGKKAGMGRILLKTAKGARDYGPDEVNCRTYIEQTLQDCFATYGGSCLDTPVFERKEILAGKYGEDAKLIFDLKDQGGEELSLRYDHTVPLSRHLAMVGSNNVQHKVWQIGKVYRRDQPVMSKGRMREFSQADFDYCGVWDTMVPDAEIISLVCTILQRLDIGEYTIKLNHRKILDGVFEVCGVPQDKIRSISSAVDKLDKLSWIEVKKEMTEEKGLSGEVADKIGEYVKHKGGEELLQKLLADSNLVANPNAKTGLEEMSTLFKFLKAFKIVDKISFDMSLARGLDYYTGIIYEAIVAASAPPPPSSSPEVESGKKKKKKKAPKVEDGEEEEIEESSVGVGSIGAGGRYDNLVGMFTSAASGKAGSTIPCVGVSIGVDRIFALIWPTWLTRGPRTKKTVAYVMAAGDGLLEERMELVGELRAAGIRCDFLAKKSPKLPAQFAAGERDEVPFAVILGVDELKQGLVTVKKQMWQFIDGNKTKVESQDKGLTVKRSELVEYLKLNGDGAHLRALERIRVGGDFYI